MFRRRESLINLACVLVSEVFCRTVPHPPAKGATHRNYHGSNVVGSLMRGERPLTRVQWLSSEGWESITLHQMEVEASPG